MADQRITIGIGTTYTGEGMTKALGTMKQLSGAVTRSAGIVSAMAGTMGDLDTSTAKAMNAVAGMMQAVASGSPVVIGMTASMVVLSKVMGDQKKKLEELKAAADELKKSVDAAFSKALTNSLAAAQSQAAALVVDFDKITKSANAFSAALRGVQSSNDKGSIIHLQTQKLNAMIKAQADGGEVLVAAEYDLLIAKEKAAQAQNSATADLAAATKAAADNEARTRKLEEARDKLIEEQSHLEVALLNSEGDARAKVVAALEKVKAEQERYSALVADNLDAQGVLEANVAKAKSDLANAERQAALDTLTAQNNLDKLRKAEEEAKKQRIEAEKKEAEEMERAAVLDLNGKLEAAMKGQIDAHKAVEAAERNYAAALYNYNKNINRHLARARLGEAFHGANAADQNAAADAAIANGIADGSIRNSADLNNARKAAKRANRDYNSSQAAFRERRDAEEYAKLSSMSPKRMNQWQKNRLADLQKLKDAKDADAKNLADAEQAKKDAQMKEAQMQSDVADIKQILSERFGAQ